MSNKWKRTTQKYIAEYIEFPIDTTGIARTYMPGYDVGDWLTYKEDKDLYTAFKICKVSNQNPYSYYANQESDDLYIHLSILEIRPKSKTFTNIEQFRHMWATPNCIDYAHLLKNYRPLTENEKLLYINEC